MIRIGIRDDDTLARGLLASTVDRSPDLQVVVSCASGEEALAVEDPVDIWLMDMRMPRHDRPAGMPNTDSSSPGAAGVAVDRFW